MTAYHIIPINNSSDTFKLAEKPDTYTAAWLSGFIEGLHFEGVQMSREYGPQLTREGMTLEQAADFLQCDV